MTGMVLDPDRARGALWGQAVGDACGTTQEFTRGRNPQPFPHINVEPQTGIVGGGPFGLEAGQVTDDTQMAVCLAESLADRGRFDAEDVAKRYVVWSETAFDIGRQTRASLAKVRAGLPALEAGKKVWNEARQRPAGNGSLMRCSPLPVFFAEDPEALRQASLDDSSITHGDPRCLWACAAFTAAMRSALHGADATSMWRAAMETLPADSVLREDLTLAMREDPDLYSDTVHMYRFAGFVRVAFRLAFWELFHAPTFEAAVLDCTNRGGDADTNAAITGALYGSMAGASSIPKEWIGLVKGAPDDPYHPTRLLRVLSD